MATTFNLLGIYGIQAPEENLMLQSLITGDPMLMVGKHGSAKTAAAANLAIALGLDFQAYDASKSMFEDMLGLPNPTAMQQGRMEYIQGPMTLWDKKFLFIDEVNRASVETQSKWLEIIRSRQVMGFPLSVNFIWGAMNPIGYEGAKVMDEAYCGRFASFVYVPSIMDMHDDDRCAIIDAVGFDDAPALGYWTKKERKITKNVEDLKKIGVHIKTLLTIATEQYEFLSNSPMMHTITKFISKFAKALHVRTQNLSDMNTLELDGRRLGMMRRTIIATRAVEIACSQFYSMPLRPFTETAQYAILGSIPTGVNEEGGINEKATSHIINVFQQLQDYFDEDKDLATVELNYELMVSPNMVRKAEILLTEDIGAIAKNSAWTQMLQLQNLDMTALSLLALNMEIDNEGLIPSNVLDQMNKKVQQKLFNIHALTIGGQNVKFYKPIKDILSKYDNVLEKLICYLNVAQFMHDTRSTDYTDGKIKDLIQQCDHDVEHVHNIIEKVKQKVKNSGVTNVSC